MNVAKLHHPTPQPSADIILEQHVIGNHDRGAASRLERSDDVLNEGELLVRGVCRDRKIGPRRPSSAFLRAERRVRQDDIGFADPLTVRGKRVAALDHAFDAVKHEIHQAEPVRVGHELKPDEGVVPLKEGLRFRQLIEIVGLVLDVAIGGDQKPARAGGRVLHDFARLRLHQANDAIDQRARREILPCPGFLLGGVLFQQAFIEIAEALFARRKPVELVDRIGERLEIGGLAQLGLRVGEDRQGRAGLSSFADCRDRAAAGGNIPADRCPRASRELLPAIAFGQPLLMAGLGQHLQKQQERQLGDVIRVGDPVVTQDVAEVPELRDDLARDAVAVCHAATFFHTSSLISPRTASSCAAENLVQPLKPAVLAERFFVNGGAVHDELSQDLLLDALQPFPLHLRPWPACQNALHGGLAPAHRRA